MQNKKKENKKLGNKGKPGAIFTVLMLIFNLLLLIFLYTSAKN